MLRVLTRFATLIIAVFSSFSSKIFTLLVPRRPVVDDVEGGTGLKLAGLHGPCSAPEHRRTEDSEETAFLVGSRYVDKQRPTYSTPFAHTAPRPFPSARSQGPNAANVPRLYPFTSNIVVHADPIAQPIKTTLPARLPLGNISNTHGDGIDSALTRTRSPHRSIKRIPAFADLHSECDELAVSQAPTSTCAPGSDGWEVDKRRLLGAVRVWSAHVSCEAKRRSLPVSLSGGSAIPSSSGNKEETRRASAPSNLGSTPVATTVSVRLSVGERLQHALAAAPHLSGRAVDSVTAQFLVDDEASFEEIDINADADRTFVAGVADTSASSTDTEATTIPAFFPGLKPQMQRKLILVSEPADEDTESELAYLHTTPAPSPPRGPSPSPSSASFSAVLSASGCSMISNTSTRASDGTLGEVIEALEEMFKSPKWLSLLDLEGAACRAEARCSIPI